MEYNNFEDMLTYGGSFLVSLCKTFCKADGSNLNRLANAYPEVHRAYMHYIKSKETNMPIPVSNPFASTPRESL